MTVTLTLKPDIESELLTRSQAAGLTVEQYVLFMLEGIALSTAPDTSSPEQRVVAFQLWSANHRATPPLSDYAVSREAMYEGRDY